MIRDNLYREGRILDSTYLTNLKTDGCNKASDEEITSLVENSAIIAIDGIVFNIRDGNVVRALISDGSWTLACYMNMCINTFLNWEPKGDIKIDLNFGHSNARRSLTKLIELDARFSIEEDQTVVYLTKESFLEWQLTRM